MSFEFLKRLLTIKFKSDIRLAKILSGGSVLNKNNTSVGVYILTKIKFYLFCLINSYFPIFLITEMFICK